ncbi:MAG: bifunctional folylpolyglutamate synthase/dihydrofolate synthase, partial [Mailhella sp.]|nr:bifunctional folylpolyglutamate synthase/dihydrofolate synthase [Mailhella sp.]
PVFVPAIEDNPRAAQKEELAALLGQPAHPTDSLTDALARAREAAGKKPVLVCGSLYLLAEVFAMWPELLERS